MTKGIMSPPANVRPPYLQNVGIEQHLDGQVPRDLTFVDETGRVVKLGDYFGKKPLILNLVYYNCTMLCGEVLSGLTGAMKMVKFDVGNEFDVVTVSFNPKETPAIAAAKKQDYLKRYGRPGAASGWHFLTGSAESINALTKAVGFQYQYDPRINQYAHATAIMVLTPQGHISRYFYGVDYPSMQCCCTAITTILRPENTARSSATSCGWEPASPFCCWGSSCSFCSGWKNSRRREETGAKQRQVVAMRCNCHPERRILFGLSSRAKSRDLAFCFITLSLN